MRISKSSSRLLARHCARKRAVSHQPCRSWCLGGPLISTTLARHPGHLLSAELRPSGVGFDSIMDPWARVQAFVFLSSQPHRIIDSVPFGEKATIRGYVRIHATALPKRSKAPKATPPGHRRRPGRSICFTAFTSTLDFVRPSSSFGLSYVRTSKDQEQT